MQSLSSIIVKKQSGIIFRHKSLILLYAFYHGDARQMKMDKISLRELLQEHLFNKKHDSDRSHGLRWLIKYLRVLAVAIYSFGSSKCQLRASALTYYSVLAIVPVCALVFAVAGGFGYDRLVKKELLENFGSVHPEVMNYIFNFADKALNNSANGMVAGIGVIVLLWTFLKVIGNIEQSFNDIWGIIKGRTIFRRISDYMSLLVIGPILIIMGGSITIWVNMVVHNVAATLPFADSVGKPMAGLLLKMLPFVAAWGLFTFVYIFVPNTKVKFRSAFFAAVISGTLYQFLQIGYIKSQVWLTGYNTVYGSLSALPLFLIWMQLNWLLVLFGTVLSFAHQNINTIEFKPGEIDLSVRFRSRLRLLLVRLIAERFVKQQPLHTDESLAQACRLPTKYIQNSLYELVEAHVIIAAMNDNDEMRSNQVYLPAVPLEKLTISFVESAVEKLNDSQSPEIRSEEIAAIDYSLAAMAESACKTPANVNLSEMTDGIIRKKAGSIKKM